MTTTTAAAAKRARRDALALRYLREADKIAGSYARRLPGLTMASRDDLRQVAREALLRAAERTEPGADPLPYLRRYVAGALRHYVRDRVRLVRVPRQLHEAGTVPLGHESLDSSRDDGTPPPIDTLPAPAWLDDDDDDEPQGPPLPILEQLLDRLPAIEAAALRLTILEGMGYREAARLLQISPMTVGRARARGLDGLRQLLAE